MKPKMVKAWCFSAMEPDGSFQRVEIEQSPKYCDAVHRTCQAAGLIVGPIVRIEVPAPVKARKAGGK